MNSFLYSMRTYSIYLVTEYMQVSYHLGTHSDFLSEYSSIIYHAVARIEKNNHGDPGHLLSLRP